MEIQEGYTDFGKNIELKNIEQICVKDAFYDYELLFEDDEFESKHIND